VVIAVQYTSTGIGIGYWYDIARDQYYWVLDIGSLFGIVLTLNLTLLLDIKMLLSTNNICKENSYFLPSQL